MLGIPRELRTPFKPLQVGGGAIRENMECTIFLPWVHELKRSVG